MYVSQIDLAFDHLPEASTPDRRLTCSPKAGAPTAWSATSRSPSKGGVNQRSYWRGPELSGLGFDPEAYSSGEYWKPLGP
jgi:hypothetical protein